MTQWGEWWRERRRAETPDHPSQGVAWDAFCVFCGWESEGVSLGQAPAVTAQRVHDLVTSCRCPVTALER